MKRPDVPEPDHRQQRRTWTDDQALLAITDGWNGGYEEHLPNASPDVVEYALYRLGEERRSLLALLARSRGRSVTCAACGEPFAPIRSTATYCSATCRQAAYRARVGQGWAKGAQDAD